MAIRDTSIGRFEKRLGPDFTATVIALRKSGMEIKDIAKQLQVSINPVYVALRVENLAPRKACEKYKGQMIAMYQDGMSTMVIAEKLGISQATVHNYLKPLGIIRLAGSWIKKGVARGKRKAISKDGLKLCTKCGLWKELDLFPNSKVSLDGKRPRCVVCDDRDRFNRRKRYSKACPDWVDGHALATVYQEAKRRTREEGVQYHVDHIVPMGRRDVSGLHVPWNLRVISQSENLKKHCSLLENL